MASQRVGRGAMVMHTTRCALRLWVGLIVVLAGFAVSTADANEWRAEDRRLRTTILLDASSNGAPIEAPLTKSVAPIRLTQENFPFEDVQPNGSDLRVYESGGRELPFYLEGFDTRRGQGVLWVPTSDISAQSIKGIDIYLGGEGARRSRSDSRAVFDGGATVLDFSGEGAVRDVSNNLARVEGQAPRASGYFGSAGVFRADAEGLRVFGMPERFMFSTWLRPETANASGTIFSRADADVDLRLTLQEGRLALESDGQLIVASAERLDAVAWRQVVVSVDETDAAIFLDGRLLATAPVRALTKGDLQIGGGPDGFVGLMDNIVIDRRIASSGEIASRFVIESDPRFVRYGHEAERRPFNSFAYIIPLLSRLTIEGWIVLGICAVMLLQVAIVAGGKVLLLMRTDAGNARFEEAFERIDDVFGLFNNPSTAFDGSTHFMVYEAGVSEARRYIDPDSLALRVGAVDAVKAMVEAAVTRQSERLHRHLVLLAFAISGGPLVGLLGTVLGVMTTFASVADKGVVTIGAVAPGVAAALVATAAGVAVALPALFVYNWATSRIHGVISDMRVFADILIARISVQDGVARSSGPGA